MSNIFSKYEKSMSGVKVIDSNKAYVYNPKSKKKDMLNPDYNFVGKIDVVMPNFIIKMNNKNCKTSYIDDVDALPKRVKSELVNHFYDNKGNKNGRKKAYLVRTDIKNAKGSGIVK